MPELRKLVPAYVYCPIQRLGQAGRPHHNPTIPTENHDATTWLLARLDDGAGFANDRPRG